jgi:hypothetical protein
VNVAAKRFYQDRFMDLSKYRLERSAPDPEWDAAVERSPQGTIFATSPMLACLKGARPGLWSVWKERQRVAGLYVVESEDGRAAIADDLVIYAGVMFEPAPVEQSRAQTVAEQFRITSFCTARLVELYDDIFLSFAPAFVDIRPFLWHNYGTDGAHFVPDVRFTSMIDLAPNPGDRLETDPVYLNASKSRRQQIRYGRSAGVTTEPSKAADVIADLYVQTFARQGKSVDRTFVDQLASVTRSLIEHRCGQLYVTRTAKGDIGSAAVFGWDRKRAYYLYGGNAPDLRDDHTGTMVLWDALLDLRSRGIPEVDLEGVNSPLRGHFKLSFGGSVTPYYHLALRK